MKLRIDGKLGGLSFLGAGLLIGHLTTGSATTAQAPPIKLASATVPAPTPAPNDKRVLAYIYGNVPLYREDFGEFLIARKGAERFELYVNKMMIEYAAIRRGIKVTDAEIETLIDLDRGNQFKKEDFEKIVQQQYGCSVYEWKSDVIRPRVILSKLAQPRMANVKIDEGEIRKVYDVRHAKRITVKIIKWQLHEEAIAKAAFEKLRSSTEEFDRAACKQLDPSLASSGGLVKSFSKGSINDPILESAAFLLQPGDYSPIIKSGGCLLMMRCVGYDDGIPGDYESEKAGIEAELRSKVFDSKVVEVLKELKEEANPKKFFAEKPMTDAELKAQAEKELEGTGLIKTAGGIEK